MKLSNFKFKQLKDWGSQPKEGYCRKKLKYKSKSKAFKRKLKYSHSVKLYIYKCHRCKYWHLTRSSPEEYTEKRNNYKKGDKYE